MATFVAPENRMKRKSKIRLGTLIAGILTALVVVISQLFYFQTTAHSKKEVKTEQQQSEDSGDEAYITLPSSTLPSSVHIELEQSFCLLVIFSEEEEVEDQTINFTPPVSQFFQTLLGAIISPNAP